MLNKHTRTLLSACFLNGLARAILGSYTHFANLSLGLFVFGLDPYTALGIDLNARC